MELILWRHADAENGLVDESRALTAKGKKQAEKMAAFLHPRLPKDTRIVVSPAKRAQQTAMALGRNFVTEPRIAPGASAQAVLDVAGWPGAEGCTLIVGHQPTLGEAAALLMTDRPGGWSIKKGAVWWFRREREGNDQTLLRLVIAPEDL